MTRQAWTAVVAALVLIVLSGVIALTPVPYVAWDSGVTNDVLGSLDGTDEITIIGAETTDTTGSLLLTSVSVTSSNATLTLPAALLSYARDVRDVVPRDWAYPVGRSASDLAGDEVMERSVAQESATVAALSAAGIPVQENPVIDSVSTGGPSYELLQTGDIIETVNDTAVRTADEVNGIIRSLAVGATADFGIVRGGSSMTVSVITQASSTDRSVPRVGVTMRPGYRYEPQVEFNVPEVADESSGLVLSLAIYDKLRSEDLMNSRVVAGTGTIEPNGTVGAVSGISERMRGAERDGAQVFLVPAANCSEVTDVGTNMELVRVSRLSDAVSSLDALSQGRAEAVPRC
ncbi:YlbL family protein [Propionibacterium australiense]|nr:PDZ domain-containing protein [Propionibacterium australiense]SYZ32427.1 Ribosomal protein S5 domain 2-type fold, subgroup [Propionibacterium australiense]VEH90231.1 Predicted secreted protein containing a PDZ domain [Propionibacterium australiense]